MANDKMLRVTDEHKIYPKVPKEEALNKLKSHDLAVAAPPR